MKNFTVKHWSIAAFVASVLVAIGGQMYSIAGNSKDITDIKELKLDKRVAVVSADIDNIRKSLNDINVEQREQRKLMLDIYKEVKVR